ncbi:MAG: lytic transglycosylase domain-containing protein, partial [Verrucomicrobia bacterium]
LVTALTNVPPPALAETNPPIEIERQVWKRKLAARPLPKGAQELVEELKPVFVEEKIPPELIWIAEVESSFDPDARSPAGAAGLFQLMPGTAREYGLRRWPRDQRYQPVPSSRAAARYLFAMHKKFNDWPLAVAAYNAGAGHVQRLLDKHKARSFEEIAEKLPAETQMFVPKVEGVLLAREGKKLAELKTTKQ